QHLLLVDGDQLLRLEILQAHVVQDPPVVEDVPGEGRPDLPGEAARAEQLREVLRLVAEGAVDKEGGVEVGLGDADLGVLGRREPLGRADVGRRRMRSAGMPTTTSGGETGIGALPSLAGSSVGGMPSRTQSWLFAWRSPISWTGMRDSSCCKRESDWTADSSPCAPDFHWAVAFFTRPRWASMFRCV